MEPEIEVAEEESATTYVKAGTKFVTKDGEKISVSAGVTFNAGENLDTACELYSEEAVYQRYLRGVTKDLSNAIRSSLVRHLEAGVDPDTIPGVVEEELKDWRPDVSRRRSKKDPAEDILSNFSTLSPERQQEIIAQLMNSVA